MKPGFRNNQQKNKYIGLLVILLCAVLSLVALYFLRTSPHPLAREFRQVVKKILFSPRNTLVNETQGLSSITSVDYYLDNRLVSGSKPETNGDLKTVYHAGEKDRLVNCTDGYFMDIPQGCSFDFTLSPIYTRIYYDRKFEITVTREWSPYDDIDEYIDHYFLRFILSPQWRDANEVVLVEDELPNIGNFASRVVSARLCGLEDRPEKFDGYTFAYLHKNNRWFFWIMFKYDSKDESMRTVIDKALNSFQVFQPTGLSAYDFNPRPVLPETWSHETRELYKDICQSNDLQWGVFVEDVFGKGIESTIPSLEAKLDYSFDVVLGYLHMGADFPTEFMDRNFENGKLVELTYQTCYWDLFDYNPTLDIYRGRLDDEIRRFARDAKEFGHPFLFRLNNEMNSDWTDWSGVVNLCDPGIYKDVWRRFYEIFVEEGVNNAIWIFNPNDLDFPPCLWNNYLAYYPGDDFVHMIGLTGYNTGTYYKDLTGEHWREFKDIYDNIAGEYRKFFKDFPWIITEFACSSIGGNKPGWIERMFDNINNYPEIKIAVWFSYADYDPRPEYKGNVSRPYWLDETPETTMAFKKGLSRRNL